jgi:putative redox protein
MTHKVETSWKGNMKFDAMVNGHHLLMDAAPDNGGEDTGPRPKQLMIAALAGCTGMDVVFFLKKMRVNFDSLDIDIEAGVTEEQPIHYTSMHIVYKFKGSGLDMDKLKKAVDLSQDQYCGVAAVYKQTMQLTNEIQIID